MMNKVIAVVVTVYALITSTQNLPKLSILGFTLPRSVNIFRDRIRPSFRCCCCCCYNHRPTDDAVDIINKAGDGHNNHNNDSSNNHHENITIIDGPFHSNQIKAYWGQQPLFVRNAFPLSTNKNVWPSWDDIVRLSCYTTPSSSKGDNIYDYNQIESGESARFVQHVPGKLDSFTLDVGPFEMYELRRKMSTTIKKDTKKVWTLLLNDVERYYPILDTWMDEQFQTGNGSFLPRWRRDDAQISCATINGTIGPHVDNYDVCLIQISGQRLWRIKSSETMSHATEQQLLIPNIPVSVLNLTNTSDSTRIFGEQWVELLLQPGDMLYLPPRFVHWGIGQSNDCMTLSVGARAPSASDLLIHITEHVQLEPKPSSLRRYTEEFRPMSSSEINRDDSLQQLHQKRPTLSKSVKESMKSLVRNMMDDVFDDELIWDMIVGKLITDPLRYSDTYPITFAENGQTTMNGGKSVPEIIHLIQQLDDNSVSLRKVAGISSATSQVLVTENDIVDRLYVHGEMYEVYNSSMASIIFQCIDGNVPIDGAMLRKITTTDPLFKIIQELIENGFIQPYHTKI